MAEGAQVIIMIGIPRNMVDNRGGSLIDIAISNFRKNINEFEERFAELIGSRYAIAACSGRYSLELILKGLKLKRGDEVIVPAYTFYIVPQIVRKLGLKPVFVDVNPKTANIDPSELKKKVSRKTKAVIATHLFGRPADFESISKVAGKAHIIEDCAQALGTEYRGKHVGILGKAGFFSLDTTKPLNTFGGGVITTNDAQLMRAIRGEISKLPKMSFRVGLSKVLLAYKESFLTNPLVFTFLIQPLLLFAKRSRVDIVKNYQESKNRDRARVYRYSNMQARMGLKQLRLVKEKNSKRMLKAKRLAHELKGKVEILQDNPKDINTYSAFLVIVNNRDELSKKMLMNGIDSDTDMMQYCGEPSRFREAGRLAAKSLRIPLNFRLTQSQIQKIAKVVGRYAR